MKTVVSAPSAPTQIGPYSHGIAVPTGHELVFFSGVIPQQNGPSGTFWEEVSSVFDRLTFLLSETGFTLDDIVDVQAFVVNLPENGATFNVVYGTRMPKPYPARATIGVTALPMGMHVELKVTAARKSAADGSGSRPAVHEHCRHHEGCG